MKQTIAQMTEILKREFADKKFISCTRRNKIASEGWEVVGNAGFTRAIRAAGLPNNNFWSGSAPTPSTQAPKEIVKYCWTNFCKKEPN